jgi:hypothetical protein
LGPSGRSGVTPKPLLVTPNALLLPVTYVCKYFDPSWPIKCNTKTFSRNTKSVKMPTAYHDVTQRDVNLICDKFSLVLLMKSFR